MPVQSTKMPSAALRGAVLHNGERSSPTSSPNAVEGRIGAAPHYHSTASLHKLRRFNTLILILRLVSLCFSLAASIFMGMNIHTTTPNNASSTSAEAKWYQYDAFRYVLAANAIISIYSGVEIGLVMWELLKGNTLLPKMIQVWFDFGHDQAFAYMLMSASSAGTALAQNLRKGEMWIGEGKSNTCKEASVFCVQADIAISLGYASLVFVAGVCLLSGFRLSSFLVTDSRFHLSHT